MDNLYNINNVVSIIKDTARTKQKTIQKMLEDLGLNKNTLSSMNARGSWVKADTLAKIADYLECSVDYLLGRTDGPTIGNDEFTSAECKIIRDYRGLSEQGQEYIQHQMTIATEIYKKQEIHRQVEQVV